MVGETDGRPHVERARAYLELHWARKVSLDELAVAAGVSKFHLARQFALQLGAPPHTWQRRLRIERACDILRRGGTVAEAALLSGFSDASHFCRHFKKIKGTTPGEYRRGQGHPDARGDGAPED